MNYIYDIVVNFNNDLYDFYEWKKKDNIINIKKIPLFVVNNDCYKRLKCDNVKVNTSFINKIRDKTFTYNKKNIKYACLITNNIEITALLFNNKGQLTKRSCLLLDEEEQVLKEIYNKKIFDISIIDSKKRSNYIDSRTIKYKKNVIYKFINSNNDINKFKYLYYEYYNIEENNIKIIKNKINEELNSEWNNKLSNLYNTILIFNKV